MRLFKTFRPSEISLVGSEFDYLLLPLYGQSLSVSQSGLINPISSTLCQMFDVGIINPPNQFTGLITIEKKNDTLMNILNVIIENRNPLDQTVLVGTNPGSPGLTLLQLSKGTSHYDELIAGVTELKRIADAEGKTMNFPAVCWMQGEAESDQNDDLTTYQGQLEQLVLDINTDTKAITGQTNDVALMTYQVATFGDHGRYPRIALQHLSSAVENDNIYLSKTMYNADYVAAPDEVHGEPQTYAFTGAKFGYQILKELIENEVKPVFSVKSHVYSALKSTIVFNVPNIPLAFDTTEVTALPDGNKGFKLFDVFESNTDVLLNTISEPTAAITNVSLISEDTVEITYDLDPVGSRLTYGVFGIGWEQVTGTRDLADTGRVSGARGNLRDSQGLVFQKEIKDVSSNVIWNAMHNYCPIFEIQL